jgi:hypothetical protein
MENLLSKLGLAVSEEPETMDEPVLLKIDDCI